ncbi:hypothetical protein AABC73_11405 [Pseudomonas sp. G.S.17]|uniref:hypothetical protein n=1 Tax=Pseudomonas sp. G.S.17 TaxID=3137451 RepID=UPI00311CABCB
MKRNLLFATSIKLNGIAYIVSVLASEIIRALKPLFGNEVFQLPCEVMGALKS